MRSAPGFTLVEVLVALTLLSMVIAVAGSGWFTVATGFRRVEATTSILSQQTKNRSIFTEQVSQALPGIGTNDGQSTLLFSGTSESLEYITTRPLAEPGTAYMAWYWRLTRKDGKTMLQGQVAGLTGGQQISRPLDDWLDFLEVSEDSRFEYLENRPDGPAWRIRWINEQQMPIAVRLLGRDAPPIIAVIRNTLPAICANTSLPESDACR